MEALKASIYYPIMNFYWDAEYYVGRVVVRIVQLIGGEETARISESGNHDAVGTQPHLNMSETE